MKLTQFRIRTFQNTIFTWWKTNKRDLPWRHTHDPYAIAVSEIMLQQTQVSRVISKYTEFIEEYPTVLSLAKASPGAVLRIWKGMGYNRRALYLHTMAKNIVELYGNNFPKDEQSLVKLPGLGKYTARAILVFAFRQNTACVDTNIRKIITHFFFQDKEQRPAIIQAVADQLVPKGKSWEWHQALMDFGAIKLRKINPSKRRDVQNGTSQASSRLRKETIPFKETDRFIRGKIIDLLRDKNWKYQELLQYCSDKYNRPVSFMRKIIIGITKDGLISRLSDDVISLPQ
jgi:A/G-specific adenine glycosylase